jgi:hypothetical protein
MNLCPLRKRIKSADFEECYREKCEWWIKEFPLKPRWEHCAITIFGILMNEKLRNQERNG